VLAPPSLKIYASWPDLDMRALALYVQVSRLEQVHNL
jgi:hypothetical protein